MIHPGQRDGLGPKALRDLGPVGQIRAKHLDGDLSLEHMIDPLIETVPMPPSPIRSRIL